MPDALQLSVALAKNSVAILDTVAAQKGNSGLWCYVGAGEITIGRAAFADKVTVLFSGDEDTGPIRAIERPYAPGFSVLERVIWLGVVPKF